MEPGLSPSPLPCSRSGGERESLRLCDLLALCGEPPEPSTRNPFFPPPSNTSNLTITTGNVTKCHTTPQIPPFPPPLPYIPSPSTDLIHNSLCEVAESSMTSKPRQLSKPRCRVLVFRTRVPHLYLSGKPSCTKHDGRGGRKLVSLKERGLSIWFSRGRGGGGRPPGCSGRSRRLSCRG